ncbi:MAG: septum formation initiator family protein [Patescibacteria group bacterium]|jgi:cell division protein FtsB
MPIIKKKNNSFFKSKIILSISIVVLVFFIFGLVREILSRREINNQVNNLEKQITELQSQNGQISEMIDNWQDGTRLEKEARLRLGLQKPGEKAIIISKPESQVDKVSQAVDSNDNQTNLAIINNKPVDNPTKWIRYFFK